MEPSHVMHAADVASCSSSVAPQPKLNCIVVGYERDENGRRAMAIAVMLAVDLGSRVVVVSSVQPPIATPLDALNPTLFDEVLRDHETQIRKELSTFGFDRCGNLQLRVSFQSPTQLILEEAKRVSGDLIVVGSHGRHGFEHLVFGSVAESVAAKSPCPLMVIGPECVEPHEALRVILFASNVSDTEVSPGRFAVRLARITHAKLVAMHNEHEAPSMHDWERARSEVRLRQQVALAVQEEDLAGTVKTEFRITFGDTVKEILDTAVSSDAGLIVMGAGMHGPFSDRLPGRTLTNILRLSRCPVIIVAEPG